MRTRDRKLAGLSMATPPEGVEVSPGWAEWEGGPEPADVREVQEECRKWAGRSLFLISGLRIKRGFANWGFKVRPVERLKSGGRKAFEDWRRVNLAGMVDLVRETWEDWFLMDAAVAFWRAAAAPGKLKGSGAGRARLLTLQPEDCRYRDGLGLERLWVKLRLTREELELLPRVEQERYKRGEIELKEEQGEYFRVLKRGRVGRGFGCPSLYSLFRTLRAGDGLEVADALWSYVSRLALRHVKIGHEITAGPLAGKPLHFWNAQKSEDVLKFFEGRFGFADFTSNFDYSIEFPFPSLDRFDKKKFDGVFQRMALWLGPSGMFLLGQQRGLEEVWMRMLRAELAEERLKVGLHVSGVINEVFRPPVAVEVCWDDKIFHDTRQLMEFLKYLMSGGPLSQRTALEYAGEDQEEEWERKDAEAEQMENGARKHRVLPVFDPAHGTEPGNGGSEPPGQPGRPAGRKK